MGTSKGYDMPTGGNWTPLKTEATRFAKDEGQGPVSAERLLGDYLRTNGGARALSRGRGNPGGSGRGGREGQAARAVGRKLGAFLSSVGSVGFDQALRELGLGDLVGRPTDEVAAVLLDTLAEPGNTLDDHAARLALANLNADLFRDAQTYGEAGRTLVEVLDAQGLARLLGRFFGHYLYERFCRDFYENWVRRVGASQAGRSLKVVRDCIDSSIRAKLIDRDLSRFTWRGRDGLRLTEEVMRETLEIFEIPS